MNRPSKTNPRPAFRPFARPTGDAERRELAAALQAAIADGPMGQVLQHYLETARATFDGPPHVACRWCRCRRPHTVQEHDQETRRRPPGNGE